jgi:hypothetical protein
MAKHRTSRPYIAPADRSSAGTPEVVYSVACETHRHPRCAGLLFSLLADLGTRCACPCHTAEQGRAA